MSDLYRPGVSEVRARSVLTRFVQLTSELTSRRVAGMQITQQTIENALRSVPGHAQGKKPVLVIGSPLYKAMLAEGLIGSGGGLTRKGSILAERVQNARTEALFG